MSIVLKNQLDASERSATELEAELRRQHRRAMICYDVEDLARSLVTLFHEINRDVERWQGALATAAPDQAGELERAGTEWEGLYRRLAGIYEKTAGLVRTVESWSFEVDDKREFLLTWRELRGIVCFSHDRVAAAAEQVRRGEVTSLGDIAYELCDRADD